MLHETIKSICKAFYIAFSIKFHFLKLKSPDLKLYTSKLYYMRPRLINKWRKYWWIICLQCRRPRFNSWIGKIPWWRKWQLTPVFLPGESHGQMSLPGYSLWGCRVGHDWLTHTHTQQRHASKNHNSNSNDYEDTNLCDIYRLPSTVQSTIDTFFNLVYSVNQGHYAPIFLIRKIKFQRDN